MLSNRNHSVELTKRERIRILEQPSEIRILQAGRHIRDNILHGVNNQISAPIQYGRTPQRRTHLDSRTIERPTRLVQPHIRQPKRSRGGRPMRHLNKLKRHISMNSPLDESRTTTSAHRRILRVIRALRDHASRDQAQRNQRPPQHLSNRARDTNLVQKTAGDWPESSTSTQKHEVRRSDHCTATGTGSSRSTHKK